MKRNRYGLHQHFQTEKIFGTGTAFLFFSFFSIAVYCLPVRLAAGDFSDMQVLEKPKVNLPDSLGWDIDVNAGLNLSQSAYSNWTKGGENALAWVISNNAHFLYNGAKYIAAFDGKLLYGKTKIGDAGARKSEDRIDLEAMIQNKKPIISFFASVRAETQLDIGKKYSGEESRTVSNAFDPLYLYQTIGGVYNYKDNLQAQLGVSFKQTTTRNYPFWSDNPATDKIEKVRSERGLASRIKTSVTVMQNIKYTSDTKIFSTLKSLESTDIEFDNIFTAKVNKYVAVNFHYYVIYDRDASKGAQIFEGLALGLTYYLW